MGGGGNNWLIFVILGLLVVFMFVMPMLGNRKRQKEANEVFDSLAVGDEIMTIGGIMGRIVSLSTHESGERLMVIETGEGASKTTMTFTVQAIRLNYTKTKQRQQQLAQAKAQKDAEKKPEDQNADLPLEEVTADEQEQVESAETQSEN